MAAQPKDFAAAKILRTNSRRNLTTAANAVKNAVKFGMPTLPSYVSKLDNSMQVFLDACLSFRYHADREKQDAEATTVGGKDVDLYESDGDETYTEAITIYNDHKRAQEEAAAAARAPQAMPPPVPPA